MEITKAKKNLKKSTFFGLRTIRPQKNRREVQPLSLNKPLVFSERQKRVVRRQLIRKHTICCLKKSTLFWKYEKRNHRKTDEKRNH